MEHVGGKEIIESLENVLLIFMLVFYILRMIYHGGQVRKRDATHVLLGETPVEDWS